MSGASSRRKGHDEERKVASELRELGFDASTTRADHRSRDPMGVDVEAWAPLHPLAVQCKRSTSPVVRRALQEATKGADAREVPAAVCCFLADLKKPRRLLVLDWDDARVREILRRGCGIQQAEQVEALR